MAKTLLSSLLVLVVVAIAFASNPSPKRHRDALAAAIAERRPIVGLLGLARLTTLATDYHSLGVLSYTRLDDRVVTIGAFGVVLVYD
ncbi:MAG TPA: hypothetical protein DDZ76_14465 [Xanthomonadales bacterium]|nr:hypothetical protein [Xanthomonadales bacterium]